jgi:hypothetical protein
MKPSLNWSAPRPRLRRALELMLALAVTGCCHSKSEPQPPAEKFVPTPSGAARTGASKLLERLKGPDVKGPQHPIGKAMLATLDERRVPSVFSKLEGEFISNLECRELGCYAELTVENAEKALQINEFVTNAGSPLGQWTGWRFVSGLYEGSARTDKPDQQRRMTVVVLNGKPFARTR